LRARRARFVDLLIHFMVKDERRLAGWQSGLFAASGAIKPAFNSFMLPIVQASRSGSRTTVWGQVRPGSGRRVYRLQRFFHGQWVFVGHLRRTDARGSYTRVVRAAPGTRVRIVVPALKAASRPLVVR